MPNFTCYLDFKFVKVLRYRKHKKFVARALRSRKILSSTCGQVYIPNAYKSNLFLSLISIRFVTSDYPFQEPSLSSAELKSFQSPSKLNNYVLNKCIWFGSLIVLKSKWGLTEATCKRNVALKAIIMTHVFSLFCIITVGSLMLGTHGYIARPW